MKFIFLLLLTGCAVWIDTPYTTYRRRAIVVRRPTRVIIREERDIFHLRTPDDCLDYSYDPRTDRYSCN